jgi:glutaredoxin 3
MRAIVWTKTTCPYCVKAKQLLQQYNIMFEERNIQETWTKQDLLNVVPNARTVPQIFIDQKYIGGYTDLVDYFSSL